MFNLIIRTLKRVGIRLVLKEVHIESYLNFYRVDFLDKFNNWCRLSIFYNDTDFFVDEVKLIGQGRDLIYTDKIINSIELKGTYEDFLLTDSKLFTKKELDKFFEDRMEILVQRIHDLKIDGILIKEVKFFTSPSFMVFVYFTHNKVRVKPLKFFIGEEINYSEKLVGIDLLIRKIKEILSYEQLFRFN